MSTWYVYGPVVDEDGLAMWPRPEGGSRFERCQAAGGLADVQPERIPVHIGHRGATIGDVDYLEHRYRQVYAVASIDTNRIDPNDLADLDTNSRWYWSATIKPGFGSTGLGRDATVRTVADGTLVELSLTTRPASTLLRPVRCTQNKPGPRSEIDLLRHAGEVMQQRSRDPGAPLRIRHLTDNGKPADVDGEPLVAYHRHPTTGPHGMRYYTGPIGRILTVGGRPVGGNR